MIGGQAPRGRSRFSLRSSLRTRLRMAKGTRMRMSVQVPALRSHVSKLYKRLHAQQSVGLTPGRSSKESLCAPPVGARDVRRHKGSPKSRPDHPVCLQPQGQRCSALSKITRASFEPSFSNSSATSVFLSLLPLGRPTDARREAARTRCPANCWLRLIVLEPVRLLVRCGHDGC